jgi:MtN3 and saliva related transmembrane protein
MHAFSFFPPWIINVFGSIGAAGTTIAFLPQLIRVWRRKSANDISLSTFLLFSFGVASWLIYGLGIGSVPIIAANVVTLAFALAIRALKLRYNRRAHSGEFSKNLSRN